MTIHKHAYKIGPYISTRIESTIGGLVHSRVRGVWLFGHVVGGVDDLACLESNV